MRFFSLIDMQTTFSMITNGDFTAESILSVATGKIGALEVPDFFTESECATILRALQTVELGSYDEQFVVPRINKLGPAAFDFYEDGELDERYWEHAEQSTKSRSRLLDGNDPLNLAIERLAGDWRSPVRLATTADGQLFAGMIRQINNGAKMHYDDVINEFPGVLDPEPVAQLAFNCFLDAPAEGGEATVYRRRWRPEDQDHRDGYGYSAELVADTESVQVPARKGAATLFDPRNYHRVAPNGPNGNRVTLSFFMGLLPDRTLTIWS